MMHQFTAHYRTDIILILFGFALIAHSMGAYQVAGIPIPWLAEVLTIIIVLAIGYKSKYYLFSGDKILIVLIGWLFFVTIINQLFFDYSEIMPPLATTSFPVFTSLRFLKLISLLCFLFGIYWLLMEGHIDSLILIIVVMGVGVSLFAIYVYVAQLLGLPEPIRTRLGTSGGVQHTVFTYAFHRAMGSFREPSHLAQWLVVPFFLSFLIPQKLKGISFSVLIGTTILLTGSLTGIMSIIIGFISANLLINSTSILIGRFKLIDFFKNFVSLFLILFLGYCVFSLIAYSNVESNVSLSAVIVGRVKTIIEGGLIASNRGYIYKWIQYTEVPNFGLGLGNSNIFISNDMNSDLMASTLNLFITILFSGGYAGILLLLIFFLTPIYLVLKSNAARNMPENCYIFSAYIAWIVIYFVHSEEVNLMSAIPYALLVFLSKYNENIEIQY